MFNTTNHTKGFVRERGTKTESLLKYTAQTSSGWAAKANALKAAKYTAYAGKSLGALGIALTMNDDLKDGNFGVGDGVRLAVGLATTCFGGPVVVGYAILDITVGVATGTTLTDRISTGIENATKD